VPDDVPGWYDEAYRSLHVEIVNSAPPGSTLVELGVFAGKSLLGLGGLAKQAGKGLRVVGVDTFQGSEEHKVVRDADGAVQGVDHGGVLAGEAVHNLWAAGLLGTVTLLVGDSAAAAHFFADQSVWSVFIDADHSEHAVLRDVLAWQGKVANAGWLAGHDHGMFPGVTAAVDRLYPSRVVRGTTWAVRIRHKGAWYVER
jgi:hypothetical protein